MPLDKLGRYQILAEIGRGAMGVVYKAADPVLDRIVAIKTINLSFDLEERQEYEARFYQEAKAVGSLSHPVIVTIYDLGNTGELAYMAMEFLDGKELRNLIDSKQGLPVRQALSIAAQVADGLSYAHQRNIVHRDIKPANIMILRDGSAKITDFGIARMRVSDVKTQTGIRLGSPKYMSPEQVLGNALDHRSDIFSLGIVLYEMLTGQTPFMASNLEALMYQTVNNAPLPASRINPNVPQMLDLILARMLEKNPDNRYQHARDVFADLNECGRYYGDGEAAKTPDQSLYAQPLDLVVAAEPSAPASSGASSISTTEAADSRGISQLFDSFEATQRLAKEVGMTQEFESLAATLKLAPANQEPPRSPSQPPQETEPAWRVAEAPSGAIGWSRKEKYFAAIVLVVAIISSAVITVY